MLLTDLILDNFEWFGVGMLGFVGYWGISRRKKHHQEAKKILAKAKASGMNEPLTLHPEVDPVLCAGCGNCTRVCPEGDILKLINHKAVLVSPSKCVGHGECEASCPTDAIRLVFGTKTRGMDIPRITTDYETNVDGLYIAGELGGMGLIRNAVKQGTHAARHALSSLDYTAGKTDTDLLIIGAGPAGLAASLAAAELNARYLCIEQSSFGGTIANFPRQKIVMTVPVELPLAGQLKFSKNKVSKEELLLFWNDIREQNALNIQEGVRFDSLEKVDDVFHVKTTSGLIRAKKVILAIGVRGTPRKLGLPNENLSKVTYNLLDPEQYQQRDVAVVGGGNAGVECAQYLAKWELKNRVTLLVRGSGFDRCNEENQAIIHDLERRGLVKIWFNSKVKEIQRTKLVVDREGELLSIPNDYLFVMAGAEMPHKMLMGFGIQMDKKFGEGLVRKR